MKTIKELEAELQSAYECDEIDTSMSKLVMETAIKTLEDVLKLIDEWWIEFKEQVLDNGQDEEIKLKELKQKIEGK